MRIIVSLVFWMAFGYFAYLSGLERGQNLSPEAFVAQPVAERVTAVLVETAAAATRYVTAGLEGR